MPKFKKGDVCILQHCDDPSLNGRQVTLISNSNLRQVRLRGHVEMVEVYALDMICPENGRPYAAQEYKLRKVEPPKPAREIDPVVSWSDCAWSPNRSLAVSAS